MMPQLLAHLWGDYLLQSDWMANTKRLKWRAATVHAFVYSVCFFPLVWHCHRPVVVIDVIFWTHVLIDHFGLARYLVWAKNFLGPGNLSWKACSATGYPPDRPVWLAVWLTIVADNTLHLTINYLALRYL